jgi:hypothetical protein
VERAPSPLVIRPSGLAFAKPAAIGLIAAWPLLLFRGMVGSHQLGLSLWLLIAVGTTAALALVAAIYFLNVRVVVGDDLVSVRGMTGRERKWRRTDIQGCVLVSVSLAIRPTRLIVVHGRHQQFLFSITADLWDEHALQAISRALGYHHRETATFRTTYKNELLAKYPGALSFPYRHVWAVGLVGGILFGLLFVLVGVSVQTALQGKG